MIISSCSQARFIHDQVCEYHCRLINCYSILTVVEVGPQFVFENTSAFKMTIGTLRYFSEGCSFLSRPHQSGPAEGYSLQYLPEQEGRAMRFGIIMR